MNQDELKRQVALAAIERIEPMLYNDSIVGVGTGSTANFFIEALKDISHKFDGTVASSDESARRLKALNIPVYELGVVPEVVVYVDGADEVDDNRHMIKGGGGALTREKIVAAVSQHFICIVDESKRVARLGSFPLPVEVIPMARSHVARELVKLGGDPAYREEFVTDNGNQILDVGQLVIIDAPEMEWIINNITGVVTNGLFARRPADQVLISSASGVVEL